MRKHRVLLLLVSALLMAGILAAEAPSAQAGCTTVGCFNKKIRKLNKRVNNLTQHLEQDEAKLNAVDTGFNGFKACLRRVPVFSFFGYAYDFSGDDAYNPGDVNDGLTTALDFTFDPSFADVFFLSDTCGTSSIPFGRVTGGSAKK